VSTATLLYLWHRSSIDPVGDSNRYLNAVVVLTGTASVVGLCALAFDLRGSFISPFGALLPERLSSTELGTVISMKSLLWDRTSRIFDIDLHRTKAFFLFPNTFALVLGVGIPAALHAIGAARNALGKMAAASVVLASLVCLAFTTSRGGIAAMVCGIATFVYVSATRRTSTAVRRLAMVAAAGIVGIAILLFFASLQDMAEEVIYARGHGSADMRLLIYAESLKAVLQYPFGYGTYRDIPSLGPDVPPLGSHSQYISVVFKYGVLGLVAFLFFLLRVFQTWLRGLNAARARGDLAGFRFYAYTGWAFVGTTLHQAVVELSLDVTAYMVLVALWLAIAVRTSAYERAPRAFHVFAENDFAALPDGAALGEAGR
jgi:O-antigen ligase